MTINWGKERGQEESYYESSFPNENERKLPNFPRKTDAERVRDFEEEAKRNPMLKRHDIKTIRGEDERRIIKKADFWKTIAVISLLSLIILISVFLFMVNDGKLTPALIDNSTQNINVDTPDVPITNNYQHDINNNVSLTLNIDDTIADSIADDLMDIIEQRLEDLNITIN